MKPESWIELETHKGRFVSNHGRMISCVDNHARIDYAKKRILKTSINLIGYPQVAFGSGKNGSPRHIFLIHRLVAKYFLPFVDGKNHVNHIDGNKGNNYFENLEWCTHAENMKHAYSSGLVGRFKKYDDMKCLTGRTFHPVNIKKLMNGFEMSRPSASCLWRGRPHLPNVTSDEVAKERNNSAWICMYREQVLELNEAVEV